MSDADDRLPEQAHLYGSARNMLQAMQVLHAFDKARNDNRFLSTMHFLMGFCVELYLKSALARAGMSDRERKGYRHNLLDLFQEAHRRGQLDFSDLLSLGDIVAYLDDAHRKYSFRYTVPGSTVTVIETIERALVVLECLDNHLRPTPEIQALAAKLSRR